ncbi:S8 family serine peptidase [Candidatus Nomurabacteria bacterium]|nr:S8 family serine peptidase [Candidatus Nomurabacteria bacterium]
MKTPAFRMISGITVVMTVFSLIATPATAQTLRAQTVVVPRQPVQIARASLDRQMEGPIQKDRYIPVGAPVTHEYVSDEFEKAQKDKKRDYVEGEVVVKLQPGSRREVEERRLTWGQNLEVRPDQGSSDLVVLHATAGQTTQELLENLKNDPGVQYAEPNYVFSFLDQETAEPVVPNDTFYGEQWGLNSAEAGISAEQAWSVTTGSHDGPIIAVLDSGVSFTHEDLASNMWDGSQGCKDAFGNNMVCPNHGWDFADNDNDPRDEHGHGTHVAGIIAAGGNNEKGIAGVNWNAQVMALRVGDESGVIVGDVISAIDFAIQNNVKVINASWGGGYYSRSLYDAINRFGQSGGLFIAAAGNWGYDNDEYGFYPCSYDLDNIICVAATSEDGVRSAYSQYGANSVDVGAPGDYVLSTVPTFRRNYLHLGHADQGPELPAGYTTEDTWVAGDFIEKLQRIDQTNVIQGGGAIDELRHALMGDDLESYRDNHVSILNLPTIDLSGNQISPQFSFLTACDTDYYDNTWEEYFRDSMSLEFSGDGVNFDRILQYDEQLIDNNSDENDLAYANLRGYIPEQYLTENFAARFVWETDSNPENGTVGAGCAVDAVAITNFVDETLDDYNYKTGTSMATPIVSGVAGLVWSANSDLSWLQVKEIIMNTGDVLGTLAGAVKSGKRVNAYNAVVEAMGNNPEPLLPIATVCGINYYEQAPVSRPIVCDGNFETDDYTPGSIGTVNWRPWGQPEVLEKTDASSFYFGGHSLHLVTGEDKGSGLQQTNLGVEAGQTYRLSFAYRLLSGEMRTRLGIRDSNRDFEGVGYRTIEKTGENWEIYERYFTVPQDFVSDFRFVVSAKSGELYIDNVNMTPVDLTSAPIVVDGDMEGIGTANWSVWGNPNVAAKTVDERYEGLSSLHLETLGKHAGIQQKNLPLEAGKSYRLSVRYQLASGVLSQRIGINGSNADYQGALAVRYMRNVTVGGFPLEEWNELVREFTLPEVLDGPVNLVFTLKDGDAYIDNVVIEEISEPRMFVDGDMSQAGRANWRDYGTPNLVYKYYDNAKSSVVMNVDSLGKNAGVTLEHLSFVPGKTYRLTYDYKASGNRIRTHIHISGFGGNNSDFEEKYHNIAPTDEWRQYEREFTVPDEYDGREARIFFIVRDGELILDNVNIVEVAQPIQEDVI